MQVRLQAVSQPASIVESVNSIARVVSTALPIATVTRSRLRKVKQGSANKNNLIKIKPSSTSVKNKNDCITSHLKIGLLNIRSLAPKAVAVNELISDHKLDAIGLCETWLKPNEFTALNEASPPGYTSDHIPRASRKGGGVANIYDSKYKLTLKHITEFHSFEVLLMKVNQADKSFYIATIYRPPGPYTLFLNEFPEFLSNLVVMADSILIFGDFNIHMENPNDPLQKAFQAIIDSMGFIQHVSGPTHCHNHTLDLVLSREIDIVDLIIYPQNPGLSDHCLITLTVKTRNPLAPQTMSFKSRTINSRTTNKFLDILTSWLINNYDLLSK